ncbi:hypothetical protein BJ742DRAFT_766105 [Cladochytrium replicatum]|nr:hypothetical protein BJ742DRAFT_766105 [Cladochytrium replicatum]
MPNHAQNNGFPWLIPDRFHLLRDFGDTQWHRCRWFVPAIIAGVGAATVISLAVRAHHSAPALLPTTEAPGGFSRDAFEHGLEFHPAVRTRNPLIKVEPLVNRPKPVLLNNAELCGGCRPSWSRQVRWREGKVQTRGFVYDLNGRYLVPGDVAGGRYSARLDTDPK